MADLERLILDKFTINSGGKTPQTRRKESAAMSFASRMHPNCLSFDSPSSGDRKSPLKHFNSGPSLNDDHFSTKLSLSEQFPSSSSFGKHFPMKSSFEDFSSLNDNDLRPAFENKLKKKHDFDCFHMDNEDKENYKMDANVMYGKDSNSFGNPSWQSPLKLKRARLDGDEKKTPLKFSFAWNQHQSPYPSRTPLKHRPDLLEDFTSRDSGFETSSSLEGSKMTPLKTTIFPKIEEENPFQFNIQNDFAQDARELGLNLSLEPYDYDDLHDLEEEFDSEITSESMSKYEIISTDSPNINSGQSQSHVSRIFARNFEFGSPIGDVETSENFGVVSQPVRIPRRMPQRSETTRMLNFDIDSPIVPSSDAPKHLPFPARSLYSESSSIGKSSFLSQSDISSPLCSRTSKPSSSSSIPPGSRKSRLFNSLSTTSIESSCISEIEECMMFDSQPDFDVGDMPTSFKALISSEIKDKNSTLINEKDCLDSELITDSDCLAEEGQSDLSKLENADVFVSSPAVIRRPVFRRCVSLSVSRKRCEESDGGSASKKRKGEHRPALQRAMSENEGIKMALARSCSEPDLIGDFSRPYMLPLSESEHSDLKSISSETLAKLIGGHYKHLVPHYQIIDCRYPYEFDGGHIQGARNLYTEGMVRHHLVDGLTDSPPTILVFHCEFSTQRGPNMCRYLRSADRSSNKESYPRLLHPELYVLRGGYRRFHSAHTHLCSGGYVPMLHPDHTHLMRTMRAQGNRRHP